MENFRHIKEPIKIAGRIATQVTLFFGNFVAGKLVIDHLSVRGGQLNLNISPACLSTPECTQNLVPYVALAVLGLAVENIFWKRETRGEDGTERYDGGFKYQ
jgi:hypothetical protein